MLREMTLIEPWTTEWDFKVSVWVPDPITPDRMGTLSIVCNRMGGPLNSQRVLLVNRTALLVEGKLLY